MPFQPAGIAILLASQKENCVNAVVHVTHNKYLAFFAENIENISIVYIFKLLVDKACIVKPSRMSVIVTIQQPLCTLAMADSREKGKVYLIGES